MTEIFSVRGGRLFSIGIWGLVSAMIFLWSGLLYFDFSPSGYNIKRVIQTLWFLLICILLLNREVREPINQVILNIPIFSLCLFTIAIIAGVVSSLQAEYSYKGIQEVALYLLLFLSVLFIAAANLSDQQIIFIITCIGAGVFLYFYGFLFRYAVHLQHPPDAWMHTTYQFSNPRALNHAQNWLIPLLALLPVFASKHSNRLKRVSWIPVVLMYFFLFLTGGRGLTLALLMAFVASYCLFKKSIMPLLRVHLYSAVAGLMIYLLLIQFIPYVLGSGLDINGVRRLGSGDSSAVRLVLWKQALEVFSYHPWLGKGPQHYILMTGRGPGSPHNLILQWLSEWGVIATISFTGAILVGFMKGYAFLNKIVLSFNSTNESRLIMISLLMGMISAFVHSQVSGVFITPMSQLLMTLVFGIALGRFKERFKEKEKKEHFSNKWLTNTFYGGIFFLGVSYFAIFYWEFLAEQYPVALFMESAAPRFWQNGAFPLHL